MRSSECLMLTMCWGLKGMISNDEALRCIRPARGAAVMSISNYFQGHVTKHWSHLATPSCLALWSMGLGILGTWQMQTGMQPRCAVVRTFPSRMLTVSLHVSAGKIWRRLQRQYRFREPANLMQRSSSSGWAALWLSIIRRPPSHGHGHSHSIQQGPCIPRLKVHGHP